MEDHRIAAGAAPGAIVRFLRLLPSAPAPQRADRSAAGLLPIRAVRYCDAITTAGAWGWWVFPPLDLSFYWDGEVIFWSCAEFPDWMALDDAAQYPHFSAAFDQMAPQAAQGCAPPLPHPPARTRHHPALDRTDRAHRAGVEPEHPPPRQPGLAARHHPV